METGYTRRSFLKLGTAAAVAAGNVTSILGHSSGEPAGSRYEAEVPDTLDLAERAELSINALTGAADPVHKCDTYHCSHIDHRPAYMTLRWSGPCEPKPVQALPMMRVMSGSRLNTDLDGQMMEDLLRDVDADGLWWLKTEGRPWRAETFKVDQVWTMSQARLIGALLDWYQYDGDSKWLNIAERMTNGLAKIALRNGDHAWYYTTLTRSGWEGDTTPSAAMIKSNAEGPAHSEPAKGSIYDNGNALHALARWYAVSGDKKTLDTARRVAKFMLKPTMWGSTEGATMVASAQHAHWQGHFHSQTRGVMGLLEYAIATNDEITKRFVADFYEYTRNFGLWRIGFFPAVIGPLKQVEEGNKEWGKGQVCEGCAIADMVWLAAGLSEAGIGDYWDDVDQYVRNHLVEHQLLRRDLLQEIIASGPEHRVDRRMETDDRVIERNIGAFVSCSDPTILYAWWTMCCNGNCPGALYKAWASTLRYTGGTTQVNLLLNRASPWLDVDSYLPYEGKVVLKNKTTTQAYVRMPLWVDKKAVRCRVNERERSPRWLNNYLIVAGLAKTDVVTIEFPVVETTEKWTEPTYAQEYTCQFRGNTLVDISPRAGRPSWTQMGSDDGSKFPVQKGYPIYQRGSYKRDKASVRTVQRYVAKTII